MNEYDDFTDGILCFAFLFIIFVSVFMIFAVAMAEEAEIPITAKIIKSTESVPLDENCPDCVLPEKIEEDVQTTTDEEGTVIYE